MKKMILVASILAAASQGFAGSEGNEGGGGGNLRNRSAISDYEVSWVTHSVPKALRAALTYISNSSGFPIERTLAQRTMGLVDLPQTSYVIQKAACKSPEGLRDASAVGRGMSGKICLSLDRLNSRTLQANWDKELIALIAHELGHLAGLNEPQAKRLQDTVANFFNPVSIEFAANVRSHVRDFLKWYSDELNVARNALANANNQRSLFVGCQKIQSVRKQLIANLLAPEDTESVYRSHAVLSEVDKKRVNFTEIKLTQLYSACGEYLLDEDESKQAIRGKKLYEEYYFSKKATLTYAEYMDKFDLPYKHQDVPGLVVRKIENLLSPQTMIELDEVTTTLAKLAQKYIVLN